MEEKNGRRKKVRRGRRRETDGGKMRERETVSTRHRMEKWKREENSIREDGRRSRYLPYSKVFEFLVGCDINPWRLEYRLTTAARCTTASCAHKDIQIDLRMLDRLLTYQACPLLAARCKAVQTQSTSIDIKTRNIQGFNRTSTSLHTANR